MTPLTDPTGVFAAAQSGTPRCVVLFLAKRQVAPSPADLAGIATVLRRLQSQGWLLSVRAMLAPNFVDEPTGYATGFAHDIDIGGMFEAPSMTAAMAGTVALEQAGWGKLFTTEWLLGPREFAAVQGAQPDRDRPWGFLALWEWNDAWSAATPEERRDYDAECDVAFASDLASGIDIAGRHRLDWASRWHHLGAWEAESPAAIDAAMREHERAADFKFTTSRHYIGRRTPLLALIGSAA
ncbi:hypothetical protein [Acidisoma cladoniae]|jgi:hypothetical protein|uniref:hypothetical protein n=1 Tax=Acidisoma cladoniae TaxID=3040935 RepID=UPI00254FD85F|nr:hypothetical protein [Acidisoma sp. PAMC 29798]